MIANVKFYIIHIIIRLYNEVTSVWTNVLYATIKSGMKWNETEKKKKLFSYSCVFIYFFFFINSSSQTRKPSFSHKKNSSIWIALRRITFYFSFRQTMIGIYVIFFISSIIHHDWYLILFCSSILEDLLMIIRCFLFYEMIHLFISNSNWFLWKSTQLIQYLSRFSLFYTHSLIAYYFFNNQSSFNQHRKFNNWIVDRGERERDE
jgi:hypothetical protein